MVIIYCLTYEYKMYSNYYVDKIVFYMILINYCPFINKQLVKKFILFKSNSYNTSICLTILIVAKKYCNFSRIYYNLKFVKLY